MSELIRIVSRKSPLALWQTNLIARRLEEVHGVRTEIVTMDTTGDKIRDRPLPEIGAKGLFTMELEQALLSGDAELAVHSLKDLPSTLPDGLAYAGSTKRAAPTDCLVSTRWSSFDDLPDGAVIATGSVRRRAQLLAQKPGLKFEELRGNIDTRLRKLTEHGWDAIVMATAALHRMDRADLVAAELDEDRFVPAVSQGAIGIEIREDRDDIAELVRGISDDDTVTAVRAERYFGARLQAGCSVPVAAYCQRDANGWRFTGWVGTLDGSRVLHSSLRGSDALDLAERLATGFVGSGAHEILGR